MKTLMTLILLLCCSTTCGSDFVYEGEWTTSRNKKLDGIMTAEVDSLGSDKWKAHFHGVWQGVKFSYHVDFTGPADKLKGTAVIDGANYTWNGEIGQESPGWFNGDFTGDRYTGKFRLKEKKK